MTLSRLYFIFKYDKLLFCSTIMGICHRLGVIKKSTKWGSPILVLYMNTYSCVLCNEIMRELYNSVKYSIYQYL